MPEFLKQAKEPLFPKVLWNKPVNKRAAKQVLIVGGHSQHFKFTQAIYQAAIEAGVGAAKVVLPDVLEAHLGDLPDALFVPSTPTGSLAKLAYEPIKGFAAEVDGIILAGELSNNTETIGLIENLLRELELPVAMGDEIIKMMFYGPRALFTHPKRLLIAQTQTLMRLAEKLQLPIEINTKSGLLNKINFLKQLAAAYPADYALVGTEFIVSSQSQISVTDLPQFTEAQVIANMATYWLQHANSFEALTTAAYSLLEI